MNLTIKVNELIERGRAIKANDPDIEEVKFKIENIPHAELDAYRREWNRDHPEIGYKEMNSLFNRMWFGIYEHDLHEAVSIYMYSVPVKIKTTIEVIEETEAV